MSVIYLGLDNPVVWELQVDGNPVNPGSVTRAVLWFPGYAMSDGQAVTLDTNTNTTIELVESATRVRIIAGHLPFKPGTHKCYLTVYDAAHPDGLAWDSRLVEVESWYPE